MRFYRKHPRRPRQTRPTPQRHLRPGEAEILNAVIDDAGDEPTARTMFAAAGITGPDLERIVRIWAVWRPALKSGGGQ